jgi:hypothetical protein
MAAVLFLELPSENNLKRRPGNRAAVFVLAAAGLL